MTKPLEVIKANISGLTERELAMVMPLIANRCGQIGLFKTMHAMQPALHAVGYEVADRIEAAEQTAKKDAERRTLSWKKIRGQP